MDLTKITVSQGLDILDSDITSLSAEALSLANAVKEFPTSRDLDDFISQLQNLSGQIKAAENEKAKVLSFLQERLPVE